MRLTFINFTRSAKVAELTLKHSNLPERYIKRVLEDVQYKAPNLPQYRQITVKKIKENFDLARPWTVAFQLRNLKPNRRIYVEPIKDWSVFRGDRVEILTGKDKGKQGLVCEIIQERNWVFVKGLNMYLKIVGKTKSFPGMLLKKEAPLLVTTDIAIVDPEDLKPTKVLWRYTESGERVRVSSRSGRIIPMPFLEEETYDYKTKNAYAENDSKDTVDKEVTRITFVPTLQTFEMNIMEELGIKEERVPAKLKVFENKANGVLMHSTKKQKGGDDTQVPRK